MSRTHEDIAESLAQMSAPVREVKYLDDDGWDFDPALNGGSITGERVTSAGTRGRSLTPSAIYKRNIYVQRCIASICNNLSNAELRSFTKNGKDITGGKLYDTLQRPSRGVDGKEFVSQLSTYFDIHGCFAFYWSPEEELLALDPDRLHVAQPRQPNSPADVKAWRYLWPDGRKQEIPASRVFYRRTFNPDHCVEGLSPIEVGRTVIEGQMHALQYNLEFFGNSARVDQIVNLGDGASFRDVDQFRKRWQQEYGGVGRSHHTFFTTGEVDVLDLQSKLEGNFLESISGANHFIRTLWGVPAVEMGESDESRHDTAADERKTYLESTLLPRARIITSALQEWADRWMTNTPRSIARPREEGGQEKVNRHCKAAMGMNPRDMIVILDTDTMPIAQQVQLDRAEHADALKKAFHWSPARAQEWAMPGEYITEEQEDVWAEAGLVNLTNPEMNAMFMPGAGGDGSGAEQNQPGENTGASPRGEDTPEGNRSRNRKALKQFLRKLYFLSVEHAKGKTLWSLSQADELAQKFGVLDEVKDDIRVLRNTLRELRPDADQTKLLFKQMKVR